MEIPRKLQKLVDHLDAEYKRRLEFLAQKLLNEHVIPVCERQKLSFTVMNGVPRFVGQSGDYVDVPKKLHEVFELCDCNGNRVFWYMEDFKFNEEVDFNEADTRYFNERYKNKTLAEIVFSPAFPMLGA